MADEATERDYYAVLGIIRTATADQIRSAFHRFAREHHPDNFVGDPPEESNRRTEYYQLGTEAYRVLLDSDKRAIYDEGLSKGSLRYTASRADETRRTLRPPGGVMLRSSKARVFFSRAHKAIKVEDWPQAKLNLQLALQSEPENDDLRSKLDEVVGHMKRK
ncbi:MAG: DnaJ domain-containing protein [Polyangiales bacterium]